ncbi:hypothetical protein R1flu_012845 [Riccia fluitans]|uniref:Uncharacterized protein n=1 Tax=Riccia fluitans TaxID=41844 RepID=A0ABD1ZCZ7_9MARC
MGKETAGVAAGRQGAGGGEKEDDIATAADRKLGAREGRAAGALRPSKGDEEELEDEVEREAGEMHQLPRSSLAAASIPPAPPVAGGGGKGSLLFHSPQKYNNHHHHHFYHHNDHNHHQHQGSPVKDHNLHRTSSSSPLSKASARTAAAASFKQRTVGQKMPGGDATACPPIQFAVSSSSTAAGPPQLARPVPVPARSPNHGIQAAEGHEAGLHFQGSGRPSSSSLPPPLAAPVANSGSRTPVKGSAQSHSRAARHPIVSRIASPGVVLQRYSTEEIGQEGQLVPSIGVQGSVAAIPTARNHPQVATTSGSQGVAAASPKPSQNHASHLQQQTGALQQQQQVSSAAVRPLVSGANPATNTDVLFRESSPDSSILVKVCDRKVMLPSELDPTSLYALCRRWIRNDVPRTDQQAQLWEQPPLPRPLTPAEAENAESEATDNGNKEDSSPFMEPVMEKPVESMSEQELMQHHVDHFKNVRKRCREDRSRRVARFKQRLALLIPANPENGRRDSLSDPSHHP